MKSDERAGRGDVRTEPAISFVVISGREMHDKRAGVGRARDAEELEQIEILFNDVAGFIFPDPVAFDEIEIRNIEMMIAVTDSA